ncbi:MAG: hypothetical protein RLZZ180_629 [Pseudomonadota bacterium]|jgi:gamma-glutamylcyclotransferase (GGCT)/AIG2-like uncharacterized protein YtfP
MVQMMPEDPSPSGDLDDPIGVERPLFVYGTLRCTGSNDIRRFGPHSRLLGRARVRGQLHDLGAYPGLVLGGGQWVWGELHAIGPALEPALDALEEVWPQCSGEYWRRHARVHWCLEGGAHRELSALLYEMDPLRAQAWPLIDSGDWLTHLVHRGAGGQVW